MNVPIKWNEDVNNLEGHLDEYAHWRRPDLAPGSAAWARGTEEQVVALNYVCPCGCGQAGTVPVLPGYGGANWEWNGDLLLPTLTPSILRRPPYSCGWHGYLTKGEFVTA